MQATATAFKAGNSVVVALPNSWRKKNEVHAGDKMVLDTAVSGEITFRKLNEQPSNECFSEMLDFLESLPTDSWPYGDNKEDDRALLAERYE